LSASNDETKQETQNKKDKKVNQGTTDKRGSFFQTILKRAEDFLKEEE
jgi:hypothetical protein